MHLWPFSEFKSQLSDICTRSRERNGDHWQASVAFRRSDKGRLQSGIRLVPSAARPFTSCSGAYTSNALPLIVSSANTSRRIVSHSIERRSVPWKGSSMAFEISEKQTNKHKWSFSLSPRAEISNSVYQSTGDSPYTPKSSQETSRTTGPVSSRKSFTREKGKESSQRVNARRV